MGSTIKNKNKMGSNDDDVNSKKFQDELDRMCKRLDNVEKKQDEFGKG